MHVLGSLLHIANICKVISFYNSSFDARTKGPSIKYVRKIFRKSNISNPLIRTHTYQRVRNNSFSENYGYVLNRWSLMTWVEGHT